MQEKLEFEVTINEAVREAAKLMEKMVGYSEKIKTNLSTSKDTSNIATQTEQIKKQSEAIEKEKKSVSSLMAAKNELEKLEKQEIQLKGKLSVAATEQNKKNQRLKLALQEHNKTLKQNIQLEKDRLSAGKKTITIHHAQTKSVNELGIALKKNIATYNSLSKSQRENSAKGRELSNVIKQQQKDFNQAKISNNSFGKSMLNSVKSMALMYVGVSSLINVFKKVIETMMNFEKTFTNVLTLLDDDTIKKYGKNLERASLDQIKLGFAVEDTNKALFDAISAGIRAGQSQEFMAQASRLAIGGVTSLSTSVDGLTSVLNAYQLSTDETEKVAAAFFSAQKFGKTTVEELANSIGKTAPAAKQAGLSYQELLSTFAELTKQGIRTEDAATAIKATILALIKPSDKAKQAFKELGIEVGANAVKEQGLFNILQKISAAAEENADVLSELIPNVRALTGVGALGEAQLKEYDEILKIVNEDYGENSSLAQAVARQQETLSHKTKEFTGAWKSLVITLGGGESIFNKILKDIVVTFTNALSSVENFFRVGIVDKLKSLGNLIISTFEFTLFPLLKFINKIAGTNIELPRFNVEAPRESVEELNEDIIKGEEEKNKKLIELEKIRLAEEEKERKKAREEEIKKEKEKLEQLFSLQLKALQERQKLEMLNAEIADAGAKEIYDIRQRQFDESLALYKKFGKDEISEAKAINLAKINEEKSFAQAFREENKRLIDSINEQERKSFEEKRTLDKSSFELSMKQREADGESAKALAIEKKRFEIQQAIEVLEFLRLNGEAKNAQQIQLTKDLINGLEIELGELDNIKKPKLQELLGMNDEDYAATKEAAKNFVNELSGFLGQIAETRIKESETQIQQSNDVIDDLETQLKKQQDDIRAGLGGNTEVIQQQLDKEKAVRAKAQQDRKKAIKTQQALETASQISSIITAIANVVQGWSTVPLIGSILGIAAAGVMVAAFTKMKIDQAKSNKQLAEGGTGIFGGGSHKSGNDTYIPEIDRSVEVGERWDVWSKKDTNKYGGVLDAIRSGDNLKIANSLGGYNINNIIVPDNTQQLKEHNELLKKSIKYLSSIQDKEQFTYHPKGLMRIKNNGKDIHIINV